VLVLAARWAWLSPGGTGTPLRRESLRDTFGGEDRADAGLGGELAGAGANPVLQIIHCIDHTAAELPVFRASALGAVLFQRAIGKAKKSRRLGRAQVAWWQAGQGIGHLKTPVLFHLVTDGCRAAKANMAADNRGGMTKWRGCQIVTLWGRWGDGSF